MKGFYTESKYGFARKYRATHFGFFYKWNHWSKYLLSFNSLDTDDSLLLSLFSLLKKIVKWFTHLFNSATLYYVSEKKAIYWVYCWIQFKFMSINSKNLHWRLTKLLYFCWLVCPFIHFLHWLHFSLLRQGRRIYLRLKL